MTHTDSTTADRELFRVAMASFPRGVTIVTKDGHRRPLMGGSS